MKAHICVNRCITDSIPVSKNLKRFLLARYRKLCSRNGPQYAADVFKNMSEVLLRYRADPRRLEKLSGYLREFPLAQKGWVKEIFHYMDCQPMMMLDFLKLYVGMSSPLVTVEASADKQHAYLKAVGSRVDSRVPGFLVKWLEHFSAPRCCAMWSRSEYETFTDPQWTKWVPPPEWAKSFISSHSYEEYKDYYRRWNRILFGTAMISDKDAYDLIETKIPVPEAYKDFEAALLESRSLDTDFWQVCAWLDQSGLGAQTGWSDPLWAVPVPTLSDKSKAFVASYLSRHPDAFSLTSEVEADGSRVWAPRSGLSWLSGECVGEIQHIPKKGTVKRRPIAVPNRFLQMGLIPFQKQLERLVRRLPMDCTFDQGKFDKKIANRVSNSDLYVGSVDLSQATDNLPLNWGTAIVSIVLSQWMSDTVKSSYQLFLELARGRWDNDGIISRWTVGQPLGTLPSFDLLAVTHNLLLESLAFTKGFRHSPYCILGDDLLVFNKKLRKAYIRLMQSAGVPLSLHKSYEGNLVEFAGKIFIRNQIPAYRSDHNPLTWNSLFDYQRCTGVKISWRNLPKVLREKVSRVVVASGLATSDSKRVYSLAQRALMDTTGSLDGPLDQRTIDSVAAFYVALEEAEDKPALAENRSSGIISISGHPVTFGDYGYANKHGHLQRYREVQLPQWYKDKVRPCATDKALSIAAGVVKTFDATKDIKGIEA